MYDFRGHLFFGYSAGILVFCQNLSSVGGE
jgi:hypothetical protein